MPTRRICILTTTRADYDLLVPLLDEIDGRNDLESLLLVSGTHLSPAFGMTVDAIEAEGRAITARIDIDASTTTDSPAGAAAVMARGLEKFTEVLLDLTPDALVLLGDRFEILAAAAAATLAGVPIVHIHGGELTEGSFDDSIRHAVSKLSHLHFAAAEPYRQRIIQLGELPSRVFNVGAPALDNIRRTDFMDRAAIEADIGIPLLPPVLLITYHPVTRPTERSAGEEGAESHGGISALIEALSRHPGATCVFTGVNADPGHLAVDRAIRDFVAAHPERTSFHASLGRQRYLSLMKIADCVVGNSSSGVIEAPALGTSTVNIGDRQLGRLRATTVIDCTETADTIADAISQALAQGSADTTTSDFLGDGRSAERMAALLATTALSPSKQFHDLAPTAPSPVMVIAEIGVNHNGSAALAKDLIDRAAEAGADAVKFQSLHADALATQRAPKAGYQTRTTSAETSQHQMLKSLELSESDQAELHAYCQTRGLAFLSTPFDEQSLNFLVRELGLDLIKIGSGDLTNAFLLLEVARLGCDVILSTGMATIDEIERALGVLAFGYLDGDDTPGRAAFDLAYLDPRGRAALAEKVSLLQCTTEYPAPPDHLNIRVIDTLSARFGLPVGFSDHSQGSAAAIAAVARGARIVEKHITLDRAMDGPDHAASMEPDEFAAMVADIRLVEAALGDGVKAPFPTELENRTAARKSLVARAPIAQGDTFNDRNLGVKRPGNGISALDFFDMLGEISTRDYDTDELVS